MLFMLILLTECLVNTSCELEWTKRDVVSARNPMSLTLTSVGGDDACDGCDAWGRHLPRFGSLRIPDSMEFWTAAEREEGIDSKI